ncbi:hypothetical protein LO772_05190 [Yinghuangia sp. ASG 101]|uniref:hypothetical protein n=1 Tax=Yinghuangia sp. ASG 101 TaxID=2896848 RepID=UPI001E3D9BD4|nr:hypothetical protein [Yinghuangia sp. ASG 101]UGQ13020.1 hypothetical protein LO772_05190 [Yinghuangia sp. ASG 101]
MAVFMQIRLPVTTGQYDALMARMRREGTDFFHGCLAHVAVPEPGGGMLVTDVWETEDDQQAFERRMLPIAAELGLASPANPPQVAKVHAFWLPGG